MCTVSLHVKAINEALDNNDMGMLMESLQSPSTHLHSVTPGCSNSYMDKLALFKTQKAQSGKCVVLCSQFGSHPRMLDMLIPCRRNRQWMDDEQDEGGLQVLLQCQ